ncbi:hypothetical protein TNCV_4279341, partial [Trichonephila clavipes]
EREESEKERERKKDSGKKREGERKKDSGKRERRGLLHFQPVSGYINSLLSQSLLSRERECLHRQSSGASIWEGNWVLKLLAAIGIRLYGAKLKRDTSFRGMYEDCNGEKGLPYCGIRTFRPADSKFISMSLLLRRNRLRMRFAEIDSQGEPTGI